MSKLGRAYQQVVRDILESLEPNAVVREGDWVQGPDGRRDRDVFIEGLVKGTRRTALIECKDYDPSKTGPVGIGVVDEFESKRRDLAPDIAIICSNAGFTDGAVRKASRVGIGLIAVLRENDARVRVKVQDVIYVRHLRQHLNFDVHTTVRTALQTFDNVLYRGRRVGYWVTRRALQFLASNPIVDGRFTVQQSFLVPTTLDIAGRDEIVTGIQFSITISGVWLALTVTFDASEGLYDWQQRRIVRGPGAGRIKIGNLDFDKGTLVDRPPEWALQRRPARSRGEVDFGLLYIEKAPVVNPSETPDMDRLIVPEAVSLVRKEISVHHMTSTPGFERAPRGEKAKRPLVGVPLGSWGGQNKSPPSAVVRDSGARRAYGPRQVRRPK